MRLRFTIPFQCLITVEISALSNEGCVSAAVNLDFVLLQFGTKPICTLGFRSRVSVFYLFKCNYSHVYRCAVSFSFMIKNHPSVISVWLAFKLSLPHLEMFYYFYNSYKASFSALTTEDIFLVIKQYLFWQYYCSSKINLFSSLSLGDIVHVYRIMGKIKQNVLQKDHKIN